MQFHQDWSSHLGGDGEHEGELMNPTSSKAEMKPRGTVVPGSVADQQLRISAVLLLLLFVIYTTEFNSMEADVSQSISIPSTDTTLSLYGP